MYTLYLVNIFEEIDIYRLKVKVEKHKLSLQGKSSCSCLMLEFINFSVMSVAVGVSVDRERMEDANCSVFASAKQLSENNLNSSPGRI